MPSSSTLHAIHQRHDAFQESCDKTLHERIRELETALCRGPKGWFEPREPTAQYSNRRSVETLILEAKSVFGLDDISVRREEAVNCFTIASTLMVMISRCPLGRVRSLEEQTNAQPRRLSKRLCRVGTELLETIAVKLEYCGNVGVVIIEGAVDPNRDPHALSTSSISITCKAKELCKSRDREQWRGVLIRGV